jgi:lipid A disaccharide synthetase
MEPEAEQLPLPLKPVLLVTQRDGDIEEVAKSFQEEFERIKEECPNISFFAIVALGADKSICSAAAYCDACPHPTLVLPALVEKQTWLDLVNAQ